MIKSCSRVMKLREGGRKESTELEGDRKGGKQGWERGRKEE